jgi:hypothetical protein
MGEEQSCVLAVALLDDVKVEISILRHVQDGESDVYRFIHYHLRANPFDQHHLVVDDYKLL